MKIGGTTSSIAICCALRTLHNTYIDFRPAAFREYSGESAELLYLSSVLLPEGSSPSPLCRQILRENRYRFPRVTEHHDCVPPVIDSPCTRSSAMDNKERQAARCHPETLRTALVLESIATQSRYRDQ